MAFNIDHNGPVPVDGDTGESFDCLVGPNGPFLFHISLCARRCSNHAGRIRGGLHAFSNSQRIRRRRASKGDRVRLLRLWMGRKERCRMPKKEERSITKRL